MKKTYLLLLSAVLFLETHKASGDCRVVKIVRRVSEYTCDSVKELEQQGSSEMLEVSIYSDDSEHILDASTFRKTANLKRFLVKHAIIGINANAFQSMKDLSDLYITDNDLRELFKNTFENLPLKLLDLSDNAIRQMEPGTFVNLMNLQKLYMRRNDLRRIYYGIFNGLPVEIFSLSRNKISVIDSNAFADMKNLKRLQLDGNRLSNFQSNSVINHGNTLNILWLHNNSFTEINRNTLKGLDNLRLLNLQDNRISRIFPYTFENVLNLQDLVLSNNSLVNMEDEVFPEGGMPKLSRLYLNDNRLSYLTTKVLGRLTYLKHIRVGGNPWQCPCLDIILIWLNDHGVKQNCDKDYYSGTRPVCILTDEHPTSCVYESNPSNYNAFVDVNSKFPKSRPCAL